MCKSRIKFKIAPRHCKQDDNRRSSDVFAYTLLCKSDKEFGGKSEETQQQTW